MIKIAKNQQGQLSIFLGMSLLVVISFLAFIVNVGLFVKAKINLQNAVDAAAYSGAAVQARQLTNIAWLNWEIRNTYKEWLFKYYILGQKGRDSIQRVNITNTSFNNPAMNFRLTPFYKPGTDGYDPNVYDFYNVPSICIHFGSDHDICEIVTIPGLPRFSTLGLPGISEHHESFLNTLVKEKAQDCSSRSNINLATAMLWAYGTRSGSLFADTPEIASSRPGAFTESIELGLRMRNLEMMVNVPPMAEPICYQGSTKSCIQISDIDSKDFEVPLYERPVKAFWTAFRNLGGGDEKEAISDPFIQSFRLTEVPPKMFRADPNSLSGFLIPGSASTIGDEGTGPFDKSYLDLQVYPLNLVTFYTTFVSETGNFKNSGVTQEANCGGAKTALPVPGYIFGFTKNPEVMTYYTVKGEAEFVGLFYPFAEEFGINLKAYASAKPFGGRIGPKIFNIPSGGTLINPRSESEKRLTTAYFSAIDTAPVDTGTGIKAGFPIPTTTTFWASQAKLNLGGNPTLGEDIGYGIPNMIYEFDNISDLSQQGVNQPAEISVLQKATGVGNAYQNVSESQGLYDINQFRLFEENQVINPGSTITGPDILQSLYNARKPTKYEAMNYLIPLVRDDTSPDPNQVPVDDWESQGYHFATSRDPETGTMVYDLFAPLIGNGLLYEETSQFLTIIQDYVDNNKVQIEKYMNSLKELADQIRSASAGATSADAYDAAADSIHKAPLQIPGGLAVTDPQCDSLSMAQKFNQFYFADVESCGITPLKEKLTTYYTEQNEQNPRYKLFHQTPYTPNPSIEDRNLMTAYRPGVRQGANNDGTKQDRPFGGSTNITAKRNYYSVKFIHTDKLLSNGQFPYDRPSLYLEGKAGATFQPAEDFQGIKMQNPLENAELQEFGELKF